MKLFQVNSVVWAFIDSEENVWFNLKGVEKIFNNLKLPIPNQTCTWEKLSVNFPSEHRYSFPKATLFVEKEYFNCDAWVEEIMEVYEVLKTGKNSFSRSISPDLYLFYYDDNGKVISFHVYLNYSLWFEAKKIGTLLKYVNLDGFIKTIQNCFSWFHISNASKLLPENTIFFNEATLSELLLKPTKRQNTNQFKLWMLQEGLPYFYSSLKTIEEPPAKKSKYDDDDEYLESTLNEIKSSLDEIKQNKKEITFQSRDFFQQFVKETNIVTGVQKPYILCVFRLSENEFKVNITFKENVENFLAKIKNEIPHSILIYLKGNLFNTVPFIINFFITELKKLVSISNIQKDILSINCNIPELTHALDKIVNDLRNM